jgi:putative permease
MTLSTFARHAFVIVATLLAVLALWAAGTAVAIFLASLALAATVHPLIEYVQERGWHAGFAAAGIGGVVVFVLVVIAVALGPPLVGDLTRLEEDLSLALATFAKDSPEHWLNRQREQPADGSQPTENLAPALFRALALPIVGTASNLFQLGALAGICLALAFYWTLDRERFERLWLSLLPVSRRVGAQRMWRAIEREVGSYLRSEMIQFLIAVAVLWLIFWALEVRYAALVAVVAGTLTLIPWLGTLFASAVVLVLTSPKLVDWNGAWLSPQSWAALAAILLVLFVLEFFVEPRLFQRDRYNALWIALTAILLAAMWGFWGLFFGPIVGYVLQIFIRQAYPRLVQERLEITSETALRERLALLELRFAERPEVPPELLSLKQRLLELVSQREELLLRDA